jgi:thiamine biosynthesis lipoprotein
MTRRIVSMGTWAEVVAEAETQSRALTATEAAVRAIESTERRLSTWRADSELSRFNQSKPGVWVSVSADLSRDLTQAVHCSHETEGAFNPGMAALVRSWDLRGEGRSPSGAEIDAATAQSSLEHFDVEGRRARRGRAGFGVEEGGFGKGVALRDAAAAALESGARCVRLNLGGQTFFDGTCEPETIRIAHPRDRDIDIAEMTVTSASVATSGNSERGIVIGGRRIGHILDPMRGTPATDFGSVTVIAKDPVTADCVATALYVMGPSRGADWLAYHPQIKAVFAVIAAGGVELVISESIVGDLNVVNTDGLTGFLIRSDQKLGLNEAIPAAAPP